MMGFHVADFFLFVKLKAVLAAPMVSLSLQKGLKLCTCVSLIPVECLESCPA